MALDLNKKQKVQPIVGWPVNPGAPVNFDNPIPGQITAASFNAPGPANLLPKPQANPLGGFSNPKMPYTPPANALASPPPPAPSGPPSGSSPTLTADQALQAANSRAEKQRRPLPNATTTLPLIEAAPEPATPGGGTMTISGAPGAVAAIGADGRIQENPAWKKATPPVNGIGGKLNVMSPAQDAAISADPNFKSAGGLNSINNPGAFPVQPIGGVPTFESVQAQFPGASPEMVRGYYNSTVLPNAMKQQEITNQNAYQMGHLGVAQGNLGVEQAKVQGIGDLNKANIRHLNAEAAKNEFESTPDYFNAKNAASKGLADTKDAKDMQKTFYDSIKDLTLPAGYEGKHMELAKTMAHAQDPNIDLGIYIAPGSNRQGIAASQKVFEPMLAKHLQAGVPPAEAHALAYADLQAYEKQQGKSYHKPFPNLDRLYKNDRKQPDALLTPGE